MPLATPLWRLAPALLLALAGCGDGAASASSDEPAAAPATAAGLVLIDPAHPAHPGWVDLGNIPLGEIREHPIPIENLEDRPLTVRSIRAGCSCTLPSISYRADDGRLVTGNPRASGDVITLPPHARAELLLRVDSRRSPVRNKPKLITIRIVTDSELEPYFTVEARLFVEAPFSSAPDAVDLGRVPINGGGRGATRVFPADETGRVVLGVAQAPEGFDVSLSESYHLGQTAWDLEVHALPPVAAGYKVHQIQLATTGPNGEGEGAPYQIELRINGVPDLEVRPTRLLLRPLAAGELPSGEVQVLSHLPGRRLLVKGAQLEGAGSQRLLVELRADQPDERGYSASWTIRVQASEELGPEAIAGTLTLTLDDAEGTELVVPYLTLARP